MQICDKFRDVHDSDPYKEHGRDYLDDIFFHLERIPPEELYRGELFSNDEL